MLEQHRHWLVQYFMFSWLYENKKNELIWCFQSENYFLNREANNFKFRIYQDSTYLKIHIKSMLKNRDCLVALQGIFLFPQIIFESNDPDIREYNEYTRYIISEEDTAVSAVMKYN